MLVNLLLLLVFILFLIAAFFFAFAESSTIAAERVMLHHLSSEGNLRAKLVESFRNNPRRFFGTTLIGTNICIVTMSAVGAHELLPSLGVPIVLATILVDIIILVVAEITPKTLSLLNPTLNSMKVAGILEISAKILAPAIWVLTYLPSRIIKIDHIFHSGKTKLITESQLVHMISVGARQGSIKPSESERAVRVFKFADTLVQHVMVPRVDIIYLTTGDSIRKAIKIANETGKSRIPVLTEDGNDSPGFIAVKDILQIARDGRLDDSVIRHLRPIRFVPESKKILELLEEFRARSENIALAINEHGAISGVVTLEDVLEEILGEIYDEYDQEAAAAQWVEGELIIPGEFPVRKLARQLNANIPDGDYETSAGLFMHLFGNIPSAGESVKLDDTWELVALQIDLHRIVKLKVRRRA